MSCRTSNRATAAGASERWAPRTLDIDMLLYGNEVSETPMLTLPHPRMTFRRFVLEPAAEIAPRMLHPVIGWPVERLLLHLNAASDRWRSCRRREKCASQLADADSRALRRARSVDRRHLQRPSTLAAVVDDVACSCTVVASVERRPSTTPSPLPYAAAAFPKLTILLDADVAHRGADKLQWSTLVRQPGRGPTLRLQTTDPAGNRSGGAGGGRSRLA